MVVLELLNIDEFYGKTEIIEIAKGYYYYKDGERIVKLSDINTTMPTVLFREIENNMLPPLNSTQNAEDNLLQMLKETTLMNIQQENGESYGIVPEDLEDDV